MAVHSGLPVEGIQVILGNDLAGDRVWRNDSPHLVVTPCPTLMTLEPDGDVNLICSSNMLSSCVITRSMVKEQAETNKVVSKVLEVPSILSVSCDELIEKQKADSTLVE